MVKLFELIDFEVVPHDDFILGPLGMGSTAHQRHDILPKQHLDHSDAAVQVARQLQPQGVALVNPEARLSPHRDARLVLVVADVNDLIVV